MNENLPVCALCGKLPEVGHTTWVFCRTSGCLCKGVSMPREMWRRLMARPRLAPEHVKALRNLRDFAELLDLQKGSDAISAALLALGVVQNDD